MKLRMFACLGALLLTAACSNLRVAQVGPAPQVAEGMWRVADLRTAEQKQARRDSNFSAVAFLGDEDVNPAGLLLLRDALQKQRSSTATEILEISEFRVIDFFPVRLRAGGGGLLGKALLGGLVDAKTDFTFVERLQVPESENSVICIVSGRVNGKPIRTAAFQTYKESAMAVSVRNDPSFTSALRGSIDAVAKDIVAQLGQ